MRLIRASWLVDHAQEPGATLPRCEEIFSARASRAFDGEVKSRALQDDDFIQIELTRYF